MKRFLLGEDTLSIHLSSFAMEVAFLFKIGHPTPPEKARHRKPHWSFRDIRNLVLERDLLKNTGAEALTDRIITRRNMFVHDAIILEVVRPMKTELIDEILHSAGPHEQLIRDLFKPLLKPVDDLGALPDLTWYLHDESLDDARKLMSEFLEAPRRRMRTCIDSSKKGGFSTVPRQLLEIVREARSGRLDYPPFAARDNLHEVFTILEDLYGDTLFKK